MKIKKNKIRAAVVLAVMALGMGWTVLSSGVSVHADDPNATLTVSPMLQKIILNPGETYESTIKVSNSAGSTENMSYGVTIGSYSPNKGENGKDDYATFDVSERTNRNIIADWVKLSKTDGSVEPNSHDTITYTINVPKDAPAGAQYFSILVSEKDDGRNGQKNISIGSKYQLASVVYANVAGETLEKGSIKENNMPTILTNSKLEATSMVRNDGNIYTDASYVLQVWPMFSNEELCTNEENAETSMILPNTERYHVQSCDLPAVGIFRAKQIVKIFGEESVLEKTIVVCPIWLMILVLAIIIGIIVAIVILIKKHKKGVDTD